MNDPTKLVPGSEAMLRGLQPLRINAPLTARVGPFDPAEPNPEPQRIP